MGYGSPNYLQSHSYSLNPPRLGNVCVNLVNTVVLVVHKGGSGEGVYYPHSSKLFSRQSKPNGNHYICFRLPFFTVLVKRKISSFFTLCIQNQRKRLERYLSMIKNLGTRIIGILILLCMFHLTCNSFVVMSKASFSLSNER